MDNQHRKISGYRELSAEEIELMNAIKAKGAELLALQHRLMVSLNASHLAKKKAHSAALDASESAPRSAAQGARAAESDAWAELHRFEAAEPLRWASIGKTDIQTGIMALVRAVAQPAGV